MRIPALERKLLRDVLHMKSQLIAIAAVVACGIATLVTMKSTMDSLDRSREMYYSEYRFADVFAQVKSAPRAVADQLRRIPGVLQLETRVVRDVPLDVPGLDEPGTARLISVPREQRAMLNDIAIVSGRYLDAAHSDEVIVSDNFSTANNLKVGDRFRATINGHEQWLRIAGTALSPEYVYEVRGFGLSLPDNKRFGVMWMAEEAVASAFSMQAAFNDLSLVLTKDARAEDVIARIDAVLKPYGTTGAYTRHDQLSARFLNDEIEQNRKSSSVIPTIFLGVAAFLLHIVLSRLVATERDKIAVLKAFGYSNVRIAIHYLEFAFVGVGAGAIVGTLAGYYLGSLMTEMYANFYHFPFRYYHLGMDTVLAATLVTAIAAGVGAMSAVRSAVKLPPAEAMRPESPKVFTRTILERIGIYRLFSPAARFVLRNLERQKLKSVMSILAIGLAGSILVVSRFLGDAVDHIILLQFFHAQTEDVSLDLLLPSSITALEGASELPGVIYQEPYRAVPVKISHGHLTKRTALQGLVPESKLRKVVDQHLVRYDVPQEGLMLATKLASILRLDIGDTAELEIQEGLIRTVRMPVVALADELMGTNAYASLGTVNRLMREPPSVTSILLKVDPTRRAELNRELKRVPKVASATYRDVVLKSFQDTVAQNMSVSNFVMTLFAIVIALGVIYNGGRISLSERGRELSSLRVLGFSKREVSWMLLGEQAALLAVGIPLGLLLGYWFASMLPKAFDSELFRFPFVLSDETYAYAVTVMLLSALLSGVLLRRRIHRLDLISVLKTRE